MTTIDHHYTDEVVCPHCGSEYIDSIEFASAKTSDGDTDMIECEECGRPFEILFHLELRFTTTRAQGPASDPSL